MTTQAVTDVVDALIKKKRTARTKLANLSRDELMQIVDVLRDAEVELMDRDITDQELDIRFAKMEQAEINNRRF